MHVTLGITQFQKFSCPNVDLLDLDLHDDTTDKIIECPIGKFHPSIKHLHFEPGWGLTWTMPVPVEFYPENVETVTLGRWFDCDLCVPATCKQVYFDKDSRFASKLILPDGLETLILGDNYSTPITSLPKGLKKLVLGNVLHVFDCDLLPDTLEYVEFSNGTLLNFRLPDSIKYANLRMYPYTLQALPANLETIVILDSAQLPPTDKVYKVISLTGY